MGPFFYCVIHLTDQPTALRGPAQVRCSATAFRL